MKSTGLQKNSYQTNQPYVNVPSVLTDDYTFCNYCSRKYNEVAYNKHLPTCEKKFKESSIRSKITGGGSSMRGSSHSNFNRMKR
jgi:hypothetical protein